MKWSYSAKSCFQSLHKMEPKKLFSPYSCKIDYCKISYIVSARWLILLEFVWNASFYIRLVLFKENSSSDSGLLPSEDEGAAGSVQEDDPGKESDTDSFGTTDHTARFLDEAPPPKSALKHTPVRRQPSLTRGQCCKETSLLIGHMPYTSMLTWLRGLQDKLLYLVVFSLYQSLCCESADNFEIWTRTPRSHIRISTYRTWPIDTSFWRFCEVARCSQNCVPSYATHWTPLI